VRYHLGDLGYRKRSDRAARAINEHRGRIDCILQIGATFEPVGRQNLPYALFCDSNIQTSKEGAAFGVSDAGWLTENEFAAIRERERAVYQNAAVVMTISEFLRRSFLHDFGVSEARVTAVGAGPNLELAKVPRRSGTPPGGPPTILFVGKQFERKGGPVLLDAFRALKARIPEARLLIIGPSPRASEVSDIEWLGTLDKNNPEEWHKLVEAYGKAHVFCLPSLFEPFGIVILEAMYFGLPCVGTDAWAIPEMIKDGVTGFTVPRNDPTALEDRLTQLLKDRELAHRMGQAGRRRAEHHFSWDAVAARMTTCLTEHLERN
jgi:glycosyltransferase involved in cell wall biosynthesis